MKWNRKLYQTSDQLGNIKLRVWESKKKGTLCPKLLVKCGDCDREVKIYFDKNDDGFGLEVNGVHASKEEWIKIFKYIGLI